MPPLPSPAHDRRRRRTAATALLLLAAVGLGVVQPTPLAGGPRPPLPAGEPRERFVPPTPVTDERFATFPVQGPDGEPGLWVLPRASVPLDFRVEAEVVERFGLDAISQAVEVFNDTPGSRFGAHVADVVDTGVDRRRRDGVNRIFLDRQGCGGRYLARAHLWSDALTVREGRAVRNVREVDIGLCDRLSPARLADVVRHELAHIAGLDHLCDPEDDCHRPGMGEDNRCRIMYPQLLDCQEIERGDLDGLVHLHPTLPRAGGGDARSTTARMSGVTHPVPRASPRAVIADHAAPLGERLLSATLAGHAGVPHVLVDADCTAGPDGAALNRVLTLTGSVTVAGEVPPPCRATLEGAWQLETTSLTTIAEITDQMVREAGGVPTRLVVAPGPEASRGTPVAAVAASAALLLSEPLVLLGDDGDQEMLAALDRHPTIAEVLVVGDASHVPTLSLAPIAEAGVAVRRVRAADAFEAALGVTRLPDVDRHLPLGAAVMADRNPEHATAAVSLAGATDGLVIPVSSPPSRAQLTLFDEHVSRGALVGGPQAVSPQMQLELSRAVDGQR